MIHIVSILISRLKILNRGFETFPLLTTRKRTEKLMFLFPRLLAYLSHRDSVIFRVLPLLRRNKRYPSLWYASFGNILRFSLYTLQFFILCEALKLFMFLQAKEL